MIRAINSDLRLHAWGLHALATKEMANENLARENVSGLDLSVAVRTEGSQNNDWLKRMCEQVSTTTKDHTTNQGIG